MWKRLTIVWSALKSDLRLLWFAVQQPHSPAWLKLGLAAGVLYLFLPIDLIPDLLPAVLMLLRTKAREVIKSVLGFVKVRGW